MKLRRTILISAVAMGAILVASARLFPQQAFEQRVNDGGFKEIKTRNGIVFQWRVEGNLLKTVLTARTTGWVAVGFEPVDRMKGANLIIGYVKNGKVHVRDDFGTDRGKHQADVKVGGRDHVLDPSGSENSGVTEIRFSIPLDSGDSTDNPLTPGKRHRVIFAFGKGDGFETSHTVESEAVGFIIL